MAAFHRTVDTGCPRPSALPEGGGFRRSPQGPRHRRAGARGSLLLQGGRALAGNPRGGDGPSLILGRWAIAQLPRSRLRLRASLRYRLVSRAGFWKSDGSLSQRPRSRGTWSFARGGRWRFGLGSRRPAPPVWDLAHAAWQFVPLSDDRGCASNGWTRPPDRPHRLRILCDGYGLPRADRTGFSGRSRSVWRPRLRV